MVGAGIMLGFYNEEEAANAIDFQTIGLLPGMMLLVALLQPTGFFEYLATLTGRWSRGCWRTTGSTPAQDNEAIRMASENGYGGAKVLRDRVRKNDIKILPYP